MRPDSFPHDRDVMADPGSSRCVFCERIGGDGEIASNAHAVAFLDSYPLNPGHALVIPRRHEPDFFELSDEERRSVLDLVAVVKAAIDEKHAPDGYNVGLNVGVAAGQTVPHAHVHVIPRHQGDVVDPRGGIRWVLPERAAYWLK